MRRWIEYAVENYRSKNSFGFQLAKDLKERQIGQAIEKYAKIVKPEEVVALMDTTVFKSGKTGFLFTEHYLYSDRYKEEGPIELMFLEHAAVRPENNSCCVLTYEDGRTREVDISVFLDVVDVLNMMIAKRKEHEAEEEKRKRLQDTEQMEGQDAKSAKAQEKLRDSGADEELQRQISSPGADEELQRQIRDSGADEELQRQISGPGADEDGIGGSGKRTGSMGDSSFAGEAEEAFSSDYREDSKEQAETETELPMEIIQIDDLEDLEETPDETEWTAEQMQVRESEESGNAGIRTKGTEESFEQVLGQAESGDRAAMYQLAGMYYAGGQTNQDLKQALRWFRESAKEEYVPAMLRMMQFYRDGEMVKQNYRLSMSWAKKAAATGEAEGQYALADAYIYGLAGKKDADAGLAILGEMAALGNESARQKMDEIRQNMKEAKKQFDAGVRNPSTASGYYEMGMYCRKGDGYYSYPKEAVQYFKKAAEKEHVDAQYQLACAYYYGDGVKKNEDQCVKWLEKAAAKSHKEATELLGEIRGKQQTKRDKADFKGTLKQAEKGDAYAQSRVAELYLEGIGVKKDVQKGIEWYEKASETDGGYAARQLAKLYTEGKFIPVDEERAAYWRMVGGILDEL